MPAIVQERKVPAQISAAGAMDRADYVDLFTVVAGHAADRSPEQWARTAVEEVAGLGGQVLWRLGLGLQLEPSPYAIGGWTIGDRAARWIRLEAESWLLRAHIVFYLDDQRLSVATIIQYERPIAALVWPVASIVHRRAMPGLLSRTVSKLSSGREP